jgi:hypothetical protein
MIDVENPGPDEADLRTALEALVGGRFLGQRRFTAVGAGTYVPTPGTTKARVRGVGGGGSGGGADAVAGQTAIAQSGTGAGYFEVIIDVDFADAPYSIGDGGAAPAAGNNAGANGGNTTFTAGGITYTAPAGVAGLAGVSAASVSFHVPNVGPSAGANGDIKIGGGSTEPSLRLSASQGWTSNGGDSMMGKGGRGAYTFGSNTSMAGASGSGFGSGGSGGICEGTAVAVTGGAGRPGIIIIDEYGT